MLVGHESTDGHSRFWLQLGYYLEPDGDLLILRRSDGSFLAAFSAVGAEPFDEELMVWEDAD
jgi:hypothetical protein